MVESEASAVGLINIRLEVSEGLGLRDKNEIGDHRCKLILLVSTSYFIIYVVEKVTEVSTAVPNLRPRLRVVAVQVALIRD